MKSRDVIMIGTVAAGVTLLSATAWAQTADGVPGDRLVVPLPDVSTLAEAEAQALTRELAQMNVVTSECPDHDVTDPEWQLMTGTTDALIERLGLDPVAYDREYFRPAFSLLDDPANCDRIGAQADDLIARLEGMGGSTRPVTPGLAPPETPDAEPAPEETPPAE